MGRTHPVGSAGSRDDSVAGGRRRLALFQPRAAPVDRGFCQAAGHRERVRPDRGADPGRDPPTVDLAAPLPDDRRIQPSRPPVRRAGPPAVRSFADRTNGRRGRRRTGGLAPHRIRTRRAHPPSRVPRRRPFAVGRRGHLAVGRARTRPTRPTAPGGARRDGSGSRRMASARSVFSADLHPDSGAQPRADSSCLRQR